jgi:hypothetical protein
MRKRTRIRVVALLLPLMVYNAQELRRAAQVLGTPADAAQHGYADASKTDQYLRMRRENNESSRHVARILSSGN